jgi:ABC-type microcin C transport system permease subunit YejE
MASPLVCVLLAVCAGDRPITMQRPRVMPPLYLLMVVAAMLTLGFFVPVRHWIAYTWRWLGPAGYCRSGDRRIDGGALYQW